MKETLAQAKLCSSSDDDLDVSADMLALFHAGILIYMTIIQYMLI